MTHPRVPTGRPVCRPTGLKRFIRHYERLTRHMLETMPAYADVVIDIAGNHRLTESTQHLR